MDRYSFFKRKEEEKRESKTQRRQNLSKRHEVRRGQRSGILDGFRHIESPVKTPPAPIVPAAAKKKSRIELLKEWKAEKAQKVEIEKQKKKPAFVTGVVHYKATGSPKIPLKNITNPSDSILRTGVKTRSQMRAMASTVKTTQKKERPPDFNFKKLNKMGDAKFQPVNHHKFEVPKSVVDLREKLTIPVSPKITKSLRKSMLVNTLPTISEVEPVAPSKRARRSILFKTDSNMVLEQSLRTRKASAFTKSEEVTQKVHVYNSGEVSKKPSISAIKENEVPSCSSMEVTQPTLNEITDSARSRLEMDAIMYSPCIEKKRGKRSLIDERPKTEEETVADEIRKEEELRKSSVAGFKLFLLNETKRLNDLVEKWKAIIASSDTIPADVIGEVDAARGKTKLLTTDKFKQFEGLIQKYEGGDPNIRFYDLEGFRDWINLEVVDMDNIFSTLEERKGNDWATIRASPRLPKPKPPPNARPPLKVSKATKPSSLRAHIMAQRQKKLAEEKSSKETSLTVLNAEIALTSNSENDSEAAASKKDEVIETATAKKASEAEKESEVPKASTTKKRSARKAKTPVPAVEALAKLIDVKCLLVPPDGNRDIAIGAGDCSMPPLKKPELKLVPKDSPLKTPSSLYKSTLKRRFSGMEIVAASSRARASLTPKKSSDQEVTPATPVQVPEPTPKKSIMKKMSTPTSSRKTVGFVKVTTGRLDMKYLLPDEDTPPNQSPVVISMLATPTSAVSSGKTRRKRVPKTNDQTPSRRSERIANKGVTPVRI